VWSPENHGTRDSVWTSSPRNVLLPQTKPVVRTPGQRRTEVEMTLNVLDILKWPQKEADHQKKRERQKELVWNLANSLTLNTKKAKLHIYFRVADPQRLGLEDQALELQTRALFEQQEVNHSSSTNVFILFYLRIFTFFIFPLNPLLYLIHFKNPGLVNFLWTYFQTITRCPLVAGGGNEQEIVHQKCWILWKYWHY